ncbi:hypothetical protein [Vibrio phage RYC]|nr:hypothetical protein [Vibrio phage RYC]
MRYLHDQLKSNRRDKLLLAFSEKYPTVVPWFGTEDFTKPMVEHGKMSLRPFRLSPDGHPVVKEILPYYDENGEVDLDDLCEYLGLLGFNVERGSHRIGYSRRPEITVTFSEE